MLRVSWLQCRLCCFIWPLLLLGGRVLGLSNLPLLGGYFCFFALGSCFAALGTRPAWLSAGLIALCTALCMDFAVLQAAELGLLRGVVYPPTVIAILVALMVGFFCLLTLTGLQRVRLPGAGLLGGLTYPLYVIHAHFGYMMLTAFATEAHKGWAVAAAMGLSIAVAVILHVLVEHLPATFLKRLVWRTLGQPTDRAVGRLRLLRTASRSP